jgi:hypothetical protein
LTATDLAAGHCPSSRETKPCRLDGLQQLLARFRCKRGWLAGITDLLCRFSQFRKIHKMIGQQEGNRQLLLILWAG